MTCYIRVNHKLTGSVGNELPSKFITFDTETEWTPKAIKKLGPARRLDQADRYCSVNDHVLKLGVAKYYSDFGREKITFYTNDQLWEWVDSKFTKSNEKIYLFAHNLNFDAMISDMFHYLPKMGFQQTRHPVIDSGLVILNYTRPKKQTLTVLDTVNFFKSSLKEIGKDLKFPKLELKEDFETRNRKHIPAKEDTELEIYCTRDVDVTEKMILTYLDFLRDNNLGSWGNTLPSQCLNAFAHRFMDSEIWIHNNDKATALERQSYHGGRNETFFIGNYTGKITCLDFNSLYPSVMMGNPYPTNLISLTKTNNYDSLLSDMENYLVVARLKIKVDKPLYAVSRERLLFPTGTYWGTFTSPEIVRMIKDDSILEVGTVAKYTYANIFDSYVKFFYEHRLEAKHMKLDAWATLFKYMLNMLYGKFGQITQDVKCIGDANPDDVYSEMEMDCPTDDPSTWTWYTEKSIGGKKYKYSRTKSESFNSFCAIASFVTSYGRMKLLDAIETAEWKNVFYCDTDSLFVNNIGKERLKELIDKDKLGYLKEEYYSLLGMENKTLKDYITYKDCPDIGCTVKIEKIKGISKNSLKLSENDYRVYRFMKINTSMQRGNVACVREYPMTKHLSREYTKGEVMSNGWVKPIELSE